jgi:glutathione S-transferase
VIEPGVSAKANEWQAKESQVGWGNHAAMLSAIESAVADEPYVLGESFSMADVVFGGTVRYMLMVKQLDPRPVLTAYSERLAARPALQRAEARNRAVVQERGLDRR